MLCNRKALYHTPITRFESENWVDDLLFCQVLKGRGIPIQRRACCYDFVKGAGITLFPTYAAQGIVSLFHENAPQLEVIENLRDVDIPAAYKGVVVQEFTRSGMQRIFAVKRHADSVPRNQPLMVSNLDEHWVQELRRSHLLHPIPPERLRLYGLPNSEGPNLERTQIIHELARKSHHYRDTTALTKPFLAVPQMVNVGMLVYRKDLFSPPETWEKLEGLAQGLKKDEKVFPFLAETQTYDTLITFALELTWSHGAFLRTETVGNRLHVHIDPEPVGFDRFVAAIQRLYGWIHKHKYVPLRSTVDPEINRDLSWGFARHWYSTWIDYRTRRDDQGRLLINPPEEAAYGIAQIPISEEYLVAQRADPSFNGTIKHHSGWGEWYLAIQNGSENIELGIDLINNLMTSRKISERAVTGAALPTTEAFYRDNAQAICMETDRTYSEIRALFFDHAKSRMEIHQYRRVARVLSGTIRAVITNPQLTDDQIRNLLKSAFLEVDPQFTPLRDRDASK
jgi:hypothetical protein